MEHSQQAENIGNAGKKVNSVACSIETPGKGSRDPQVLQCEKNIARAIQSSPFIRLMLEGLTDAG